MRVYTRTMSNACYCIVLRKASRRISAVYDEALAPHGINIAQFSAIRNINRYEPISLTDLADKLDLDRSTVGRNMKVLERMGIVATATGADQREAALSLTDEGKALLVKTEPIWHDVQVQIEDRLGPEHSRQLSELLEAI
ncbi:MAG: MarR family transcriptional regulator [Rhizobium sp.]|nr:MarR family transcriptional regulator [Rhizobium sp.]